MKKPLTRLRLAFAATIVTAFLSMGALYLHWYWPAIGMIALCWFINRRFFVCPRCGARLSPRARLTEDVVCGKCNTYIVTGEPIPAKLRRKHCDEV